MVIFPVSHTDQDFSEDRKHWETLWNVLAGKADCKRVGNIPVICMSFYTPVAATAKSCDLVEKSSQTEATGECTCSCHVTSTPSSHNAETPGGEKEQTEGSSSKLPRDEEGEGSCAETPGGEKGNTEKNNAETSSGEDSKPEKAQKTPEEEAYDLMVNGKLI